jgi:hypothetical protein
LTTEIEKPRQRTEELEIRLAEKGVAAGGLRSVLESCKDGLNRILPTEAAGDHVRAVRAKGSSTDGPAAWVGFSAGEQAELPRETKRSVLLALGAKVVLVDRGPVVSLDIPLETPTASGSRP